MLLMWDLKSVFTLAGSEHLKSVFTLAQPALAHSISLAPRHVLKSLSWDKKVTAIPSQIPAPLVSVCQAHALL